MKRSVLPKINEADLSKALARSWNRNTSYDPSGWSEDNAAWGQCAVSALIVQDFLGGSLLVGEVNGVEHYWNLLPDNRDLDLTRHQFGSIQSLKGPFHAQRDFMLSFPDTRKRYERLRRILLNELKSTLAFPMNVKSADCLA
jgi:hypothetical protein